MNEASEEKKNNKCRKCTVRCRLCASNILPKLNFCVRFFFLFGLVFILISKKNIISFSAIFIYTTNLERDRERQRTRNRGGGVYYWASSVHTHWTITYVYILFEIVTFFFLLFYLFRIFFLMFSVPSAHTYMLHGILIRIKTSVQNQKGRKNEDQEKKLQ